MPTFDFILAHIDSDGGLDDLGVVSSTRAKERSQNLPFDVKNNTIVMFVSKNTD